MSIFVRGGLWFTWGIGLVPPSQVRGNAQLVVGDGAGRALAELDVNVKQCSWRLNDYGQCEFSIATSDPKCTETNLRFGNRVIIIFENGLPNWGGIIDTPRSWSAGSVHVTAYTAEYILTQRRTAKIENYIARSPGTIFRRLIESTNAIHNTGIIIGSVWEGAGVHTITFHYDELFTLIKEQCCERLGNADWYISAALTNGTISFTANYYERRGSIKGDVALIEGHNIGGDPDFEEQGPIGTRWIVLGPGSTWGNERLVGIKANNSAIARYGFREMIESHTEAETQTTLDDIARNRLRLTQSPRNRLALDVQDLAPGAFAAYDVGDTVNVLLHSKGFDGYNNDVRILAREYSLGTNLCKLVVQEV